MIQKHTQKEALLKIQLMEEEEQETKTILAHLLIYFTLER